MPNELLTPTDMARSVLAVARKATKDLTPEQRAQVLRAALGGLMYSDHRGEKPEK